MVETKKKKRKKKEWRVRTKIISMRTERMERRRNGSTFPTGIEIRKTCRET